MMDGISRNNSFAVSNPGINKKNDTHTSDSKELDYSAILRGTIEEMEENVKNGTIPKPVVQIGAKAYTDKEWDKLIEKVDDAIDNAKEIAKEKAEKAKKKDETEEKEQKR
ncbi:MAG: hypothetical protein IJD02_03815 [Lachnospiraceae bacterium]|nr:hypothetical protein [Lachnospiraceae bacterium]